MGGTYTTPNGGKDYYLLLDGFLRGWMDESDDDPLVSIGESGRWEIWPFGFLEDEEPQVQAALAYRNGDLDTILREASRDAVAAFLEDRTGKRRSN